MGARLFCRIASARKLIFSRTLPNRLIFSPTLPKFPKNDILITEISSPRSLYQL
jgi:hypothetical protein